MRVKLDHGAVRDSQLPISGYLDRLSAFPGETIDAFVSISCNDGHYDAQLQRVICADPNPSGPGLCFEDVGPCSSHKGRYQPIHVGSYATLPLATPAPATQRTWSLLFHVGLQVDSRVTLFSDEAQQGDDTFTASLDGMGVHVDYKEKHEFTFPERIQPHTWYKVLVSVDLELGAVRIGLAAGAKKMVYRDYNCHHLPPQFAASSQLMLAARQADAPRNVLTGKLEAPVVTQKFAATELEISERIDNDDDLIGAWDFSIGMQGNVVYDCGPRKLHGQLHNWPTRAIKGSRWSGREHRWRDAPSEYAAVHFHNDDLEDCRWERSFTFSIPKDLRSGSYALRLTAGGQREWLPFYVRPLPQDKNGTLLFLVPTFTYLAYANGRLSNLSPRCRRRNLAWSGTAYASELYPEYGCSTYDTHLDGSGVSFASRKRPLLTMRPGFLSLWDDYGSGVRHYPADSHLTAWLEAKGVPFDVVTDEDLHREGVAALQGYRNVITGTHPEYHTANTLDALSQYLDLGGNLAYMGGNGFYWKIACVPDKPHLMEIRRAEGGIRMWAAEPGEYYNALDGELGGLWSRNGRRPQGLVGVGFSAQGPFVGGPYERSPASYHPDLAWAFDGIDGATFGDYGLSGGGAAGFELDRVEAKFGSPGRTVTLATSCESPPGYVPCYEELLTDLTTVSGKLPAEMIRSDIALSITDSGGTVFAVGSITFCGSLWDGAGFEGPVSRLLANVLRRMGCFPRA